MPREFRLDSIDPHDALLLDERFRQLESMADRKLEANPFAIASRQSSVTRIAAPSGLRLVPSIGTITVQWEPVRDDDLIYYEAEFSKDASFGSAMVRRVPPTQTFYRFDEGETDTTYYVRVRAFGRQKSPSVYHSVLNTKTRLATSANLAVAAATNPFQARLLSFDPVGVATNGHGGRPTKAVWHFSETQETIGGILLPFVVVQFLYACRLDSGNTRGAILTMRFYVNGIWTGDESKLEFASDAGTGVTADPDVEAAGTGLATPVGAYAPGDTSFAVEFEVEQPVGSGENVLIDPTDMRLECVELRR